jgi:mycoredoxin
MTAITSLSPYGRRHAPADVPIVVYGRRWCAITQMVRRYLDRLGLPYEYIDLDQNPGAESQLQWLTGGRVHSPVVYLGGELLVQPSISELEWALHRSGVRLTHGLTSPTAAGSGGQTDERWLRDTLTGRSGER